MTADAQPSHRRRVRVIYHGRVQGVGFRFTTSRIASRYSVTGYVRNLPDGTVELVADGPSEDVRDFLQSIETHFAAGGNIDRAEVEDRETGEEFSDFRIRY